MSVKTHGALSNIRTRILGRSRWNILLGAISLIILIGSFSALALTTINTRENEKFTINGSSYEWDTLEDDFETIEVQGYEGTPLPALLEDAGVEDPASHDYRIIGADGYFKTVTWSDMETGILTAEEKKVVFESKAKAYWVRDVVEIEVV